MHILQSPQYRGVFLAITVGIPLVLVAVFCAIYDIPITSWEPIAMAGIAAFSQPLLAWFYLHSRNRNISSVSAVVRYVVDWALISIVCSLLSIALILYLA